MLSYSLWSGEDLGDHIFHRSMRKSLWNHLLKTWMNGHFLAGCLLLTKKYVIWNLKKRGKFGPRKFLWITPPLFATAAKCVLLNWIGLVPKENWVTTMLSCATFWHKWVQFHKPNRFIVQWILQTCSLLLLKKPSGPMLFGQYPKLSEKTTLFYDLTRDSIANNFVIDFKLMYLKRFWTGIVLGIHLVPA